MHTTTTRSLTAGLVAALAVAGGACSETVQGVPVRSLDRTTDIAPICFGTPIRPAFAGRDEQIDTKTSEVSRAQPGRACNPLVQRSEYEAYEQAAKDAGRTPRDLSELLGTAQETAGFIEPPSTFGFILESDTGTLALAFLGTPDLPRASVLDTDELTPDVNGISVGTLPVDIATDPSGCFVTVANSGSCDLAVVEVNSALDLAGAADVRRLPIVNQDGVRLAVAPEAIVSSAQSVELGSECPAGPIGPSYVALPGCGLVAAVDPATGVVLGGVQFSDSGVPQVVDGTVTCPVQCGAVPSSAALAAGAANGGVAPDGGASSALLAGHRPTAITVSAENQLVIGAADSNIITIANLDASGLPNGQLFTTALEGDIGVTDVATTGAVDVGGDSGVFGGTDGVRFYIYAIASDRTVRVVDIASLSECDTQVDPRLLGAINNPFVLSCLPVGAPTTPARRPGARGPGIRLPRNGIPIDLEILRQTVSPGDLEPPASVPPLENIDGDTMVGVFALVAARDGSVYVVNVDDDVYPDVKGARSDLYLPLTLPHQLRDGLTNRPAVPTTCAGGDTVFNTGPPRGVAFEVVPDSRVVSRANRDLLPTFATVACNKPDDQGGLPSALELDAVEELSFHAPASLRQWTYPDLRAVLDEEWNIAWEGPLSRDDESSSGGGARGIPIDGPRFRLAAVTANGSTMSLSDGAAPFCAAGMEPFDTVTLIGCSSDANCGSTETCIFSPEAPAGIVNGICVPSELADSLERPCRDFLVSRRRYSAVDVGAGSLTLVPRRQTLITTPLEGCTSDLQCEELGEVALQLAGDVSVEDAPPVDDEQKAALAGRFACEPDPSRRPGVNRCAIRCDMTPDENGFPIRPCDDGFVCSANRCVEGPVPPSECLQALQTYRMFAGESLVVMGRLLALGDTIENIDAGRTATGYIHPLVVDSSSGQCIDDPAADPLQIGRIRLDLPECVDPVEDVASSGPNPCIVSAFDNVELTVDATTGRQLETRVRRAIRFRNPIFTFHLVVPEAVAQTTDGAAVYPTVHPDFVMTFAQVGGYAPFRPVNPVATTVVMPRRLVGGPDGRFFLLDEGDIRSFGTRGQVITITPTPAIVGADLDQTRECGESRPCQFRLSLRFFALF